MTITEERENIRRAVQALEICWCCQRVSECGQVVLGGMVVTWLCPGCRSRAGRDDDDAPDFPDYPPPRDGVCDTPDEDEEEEPAEEL